MLVNLYSVRDIKTDLFESPFPAPNEQAATRTFARIVQQVPTMRDNPADFNLHHIGAIDDANGQLIPLDSVQFVCSGLSFDKPSEMENNHVQEQNSEIGDDTPVQSSP